MLGPNFDSLLLPGITEVSKLMYNDTLLGLVGDMSCFCSLGTGCSLAGSFPTILKIPHLTLDTSLHGECWCIHHNNSNINNKSLTLTFTHSLTHSGWLGVDVVTAEVLNRTGCQGRLRLVFTKKWFHLSEEQW